jgi:uncharacterized protein DUF3152
MGRRRGYLLGWVFLLATACASSSVERALPKGDEAVIQSKAPPISGPPVDQPGRVDLVIEARPTDPATAGFATVVKDTLTDPRGWQGAGFTFTFRDDAPYRIVLAERPEVERLCRPYDVGRFSCQNGPVVALNADRWRTASPKWTGDLDTYRRMLVNHEVGHLLGQHHPAVHCPQAGQPAPVMTQQSSELDGCLPNPWPRRWELDCAARHEEPLAPGYEDHPASRCGPA